MADLLIVGDGPVVEALAPMARLLDLDVRVESAYEPAAEALGQVTALIVTSHHDGVDGPILRDALARPEEELRYIGAMGSRRTQQRRADFLSQAGVEDRGRIHGPAGLDIGADGPAEIAVSILAELVATMRGASGAGSISGREGPIHPEAGPDPAYCPGG